MVDQNVTNNLSEVVKPQFILLTKCSDFTNNIVSTTKFLGISEIAIKLKVMVLIYALSDNINVGITIRHLYLVNFTPMYIM